MKFLLVLAALAAFSVTANAEPRLIDKIDAIVNSEVILRSDVERFEKTMALRRELDPIFGFSAGMDSGKPDRKQILEFLIEEKLISQTFKITDTEVEQEISSVMRNNHLSRDDLKGFLASKGFSFDEYQELMRTGLQKRNLLDREIRSRVNISDDDVRNYYFNNAKSDKSLPLEYSIGLIVLNLSTYKNTAAAEKTAREALASIKQGESFSEVAKRISDDPSAPNGGELGFVSAESLAAPLKTAVVKLQLGGLSEIIRTPAAYMIVKLIDIRSSQDDKLNEIKEQIREQMAKEEYKKQLYLWAERSKNNAFIHTN